MTIDEFALLRDWADGDSRAGDQLVVRYYGDLARFFTKIVGPRERLGLSGATFLRLHARDVENSDPRSFRSVLFAIARGVAFDFLLGQDRPGQLQCQFPTVRESPTQ